MNQSPVPGRDTVYVWVGRGAGGRPAPAGWLLRHAGATVLGRAPRDIVVGHGPCGRPLVGLRGDARVELPVSVSRADGVLVVAARAAGPVGVDVERCRPLPALALARRWFAPAEAAWLAGRGADGRSRDFLRLWTAKEAVGKALAVGLRGGGPRRLMPVPDDRGGSLRPVPGDCGRAVPGAGRLRVGHPPVDGGLVLAVAVAADDAVPVEVLPVEVLPVDALPVEVPPVGPDGLVGTAQRTAHVAAARSASAARTSLPVVVRGN
ncbi:4'-phosphopantetheinyl transferase family protein [Micromonospora sp. CPCC 205561]|uniref:4'-phosphopantetheinyl transferase family protein n=1 Tax=Micromonospora sp. CPCC 205561 TaxID=3122407 RepID=UPI002FF3A389